jgi:hypothetical protein
MHDRHLFKGSLSLLILVILFLLTPAKALHAAPLRGDEVILGDDLILNEGEHISGDLLMLGGDLTMRLGSRVEGSVTAFGGRLEIDGAVEGEVVSLGGDISLGAHARVNGDVVALGGQVNQAEGAQTGQIVKGPRVTGVGFWRRLRLPLLPLSVDSGSWSVVWTAVTTLVGGLIVALLSMATVTFWPSQTDRVIKTVVTKSLPSLGVGCLLYPLAGSLAILLLITLCLAPFTPFVILLLVAASLFGWIALGTLLGRWLVRRLGWRGATPLIAAGTGAFALTFGAVLVGTIPCLGPLMVLVIASTGLGAVALSRFGTSRFQSHPPAEPPLEA